MADTPITREEKYLAYLTGDYKADILKPITRQERYLYELCLKGMGGEVSPEEIKSAVNEYLEKNPVQPGATTEEAAQIKKNAAEINSLKESISTKITKFYASSQGKTHLADSDNGKIQDMMVHGKSEQKQYSGKNLLPTTMYSDSAVRNGVTFINNGDGSVTASGTATDIAYFTLWGYNALGDKGVLQGITPGDVLYVSDCLLQQTNSKEIISTILNGSTQFKDSTTTMYVAIRVNKGESVNKTFYPQIEKGSKATSYEPYVGGQPSPSPDYPQEIKSVVNPTVKVCGKNLLDYDAWKDTPIIRETAIYENNGITLTATERDCYSEMGKKFPDNAKIKVSEGETLTLSWEESENKEGNIFIFGNGTVNNGVSTDNRKSKKLSYTVPSGVTFITFRFGVTTTGDTISYKNIQIEKGSEPTAYEPYHEQTVTLTYTLNAIPVSSGGNVTIDGQQYIADYVDVERGKLVRMVGECVISDMNQITRITTNTFFVYGMDDVFVISDNSDDIARLQTTKYQGVALVDRTDNKYIYRCWLSTHDNLKPIAFHSNTDDLSAFKNEVYGTRIIYQLANPTEIDLTPEEVQAFKALATYYPTTNISIDSEQLDGYTVFNYPISMANGWNYVKKQLNDNRDYIYDMDTQSAEAYVNSEYAVALTELEV